MFEFEKYEYDVFDTRALAAYLSRTLMRIEILKAYYDID